MYSSKLGLIRKEKKPPPSSKILKPFRKKNMYIYVKSNKFIIFSQFFQEKERGR